MKKFLQLSSFLMITFLVWSCKSEPTPTSTGISKEDSAILIAWKQMYKDKTPEDVNNIKIDTRIIDHVWAESCVQEYKSIYSNTSDAKIKKAHTEEIVFDRIELQNWLKYLGDSTNCDSINIRLGVYPKKIYDTNKVNKNASKFKPDRLTVFLWPFNGNKKATLNIKTNAINDGNADPFNLGEIHPPY
jgi:hypothetical protein